MAVISSPPVRDQNSTDQDRTKENSQNFTLPTSIKMIDWEHIDTVLLDMDGVLLDLRFDNWFWLEHVPAQYAAKQGAEFRRRQIRTVPQGCWLSKVLCNGIALNTGSHTLELDIIELKVNNAHRISVRPLVVEFLTACLKKRKPYLVTNAHRGYYRYKTQTSLPGWLLRGGHFARMSMAHRRKNWLSGTI